VCVGVWAKALTHIARDNVITDEETAYLDDLARLLDVGCGDILAIYGQVISPRYREAVEAAAEDGVLTATERQALGRLAVSLRIPDDAEFSIRGPILQQVAQRKLNELTADRRLSPEEIQEYLNLDEDLGISLSIDAETDIAIQRFQELWRIENGQMRAVEADIQLQKGERCFFQASATWMEVRTRTKRVDYAGPVASIRIAKGLRFRIGSVVPNRVTSEELTEIDHGTVYITDKRVIFDGKHRNLAVRLSALISVAVYSDAFVAEKATGRSPYFLIHPDRVEFAAATLTTLLSER
jgi:hypothetical protein